MPTVVEEAESLKLEEVRTVTVAVEDAQVTTNEITLNWEADSDDDESISEEDSVADSEAMDYLPIGPPPVVEVQADHEGEQDETQEGIPVDSMRLDGSRLLDFVLSLWT